MCVLDQVEDLTLGLAATVLTDCKLHFLMVYRSVYESDESRVGVRVLARAAGLSDSTRANDSPIQFTCKICLCGLTRRSERFFFFILSLLLVRQILRTTSRIPPF